MSRTERGVPRVVLETDRPVQFLTVELAEGSGFDVHLLGTDPASLPAVEARPDDVVKGLEFRAGPGGVIARVLLAGERRIGRAFALESPPRVVLDLPPEEVAPATRPASQASVPAARPSASPAKPSGSAAPAEERERAPAKPEAVDERTVHAADSSARADSLDPMLSDLFGWVHDVRDAIESIRKTREVAGKAAARRRSGGFSPTAVSTRRRRRRSSPGSRRCAATRPVMPRTRWTWRNCGCGAVMPKARWRSLPRSTPSARTSAIACGWPGSSWTRAEPETVPVVLGPVLASSQPGLKARASFLLARSHWDRGEAAKALPIAQEVVTGAATPSDVLPGAVLLEADCLSSLERPAEARKSYERASTLRLNDEESSWTSLQLGNLARRAGDLEEARKHYEATKERWPDTSSRRRPIGPAVRRAAPRPAERRGGEVPWLSRSDALAPRRRSGSGRSRASIARSRSATPRSRLSRVASTTCCRRARRSARSTRSCTASGS